MDIPDASIWAALSGGAVYAFRHLKKEANECKRDRKALHEKLSTVTSAFCVLADRLGLEIDFTKTPNLSEMESNRRAMKQLRKLERAAPTDRIELKASAGESKSDSRAR